MRCEGQVMWDPFSLRGSTAVTKAPRISTTTYSSSEVSYLEEPGVSWAVYAAVALVVLAVCYVYLIGCLCCVGCSWWWWVAPDAPGSTARNSKFGPLRFWGLSTICAPWAPWAPVGPEGPLGPLGSLGPFINLC